MRRGNIPLHASVQSYGFSTTYTNFATVFIYFVPLYFLLTYFNALLGDLLVILASKNTKTFLYVIFYEKTV